MLTVLKRGLSLLSHSEIVFSTMNELRYQAEHDGSLDSDRPKLGHQCRTQIRALNIR